MRSDEVREFTTRFIPLVAGARDVDIVIAPPFTLLDCLANEIAGTAIQSSGQNVHPEESGAFTGEIAAGMLADMGCAYTIVGHSERRALFGESSEFVAQKAAALLRHEISPIVCVGETLEQRDAGRALEVVEQQIRQSLAGVAREQAEEIVVAYEPVWAIGTGKVATAGDVAEVHARIRGLLHELLGPAGTEVRILYGGSVKPNNAAELLAVDSVDGALVGGASLKAEDFWAIAASCP